MYFNRKSRRNVGLAILVFMTIVLLFAALEPVFYPLSNGQRYSDLGVLGESHTVGNYPTSVAANQPFTLYGYISNSEGTVQHYNVLVKLGNQSTIVSNSTSAAAPVIASYYAVLDENQSTTFPMQLSLGQSGLHERLIFELWSYHHSSSSGWASVYTGDWDQIWLNVTA